MISAPAIAGAFLCTLFVACRQEPPEPSAPPIVREASEPSETKPRAKPKRTKDVSEFRFVAYNVENWLSMERSVNGKEHASVPKPERSKQAVIDLLREAQPDILGLCEIGSEQDLLDLQTRLHAAGIDLPHRHYSGGADPVRHLALLSRFPISSTAKPEQTDFQLNGRTTSLQRGILDATIDVNGTPIRFLGVHLKSKREVNWADQEQIRIHEAQLVRTHADKVLRNNSQERVILYGDFNDTARSDVLKKIQGVNNSASYFYALNLKDAAGTRWTQHWAEQDVYSRFDYILVSPTLRKTIEARSSRILESKDWEQGSDHRPLLGVFSL